MPFSPIVFYRRIAAIAALLLTSVSWASAPPVDEIGVDSRTGEVIKLSELKGKVVAISFWASWCAPCRQELPVLENIQKQIPKSELRIVSVNFGEDKKLFRRHLRQLEHAEIALVHDSRKRVGKAFGVASLPFLVLIDHRGEVREIKHGYSEESLPQLIELMNSLLEERALAQANQDS